MPKTTEIDPITAQQYVELLLPVLTDEEYTAYGIATVLNKVLAKDGREAVRPQMMYNYARNGLIVKGEKITGTTLRPFTKTEVAMFIIKYCMRNGVTIGEVTSTPEVNPDQLELDLELPTQE